jgi:hypothetical protein
VSVEVGFVVLIVPYCNSSSRHPHSPDDWFVMVVVSGFFPLRQIVQQSSGNVSELPHDGKGEEVRLPRRRTALRFDRVGRRKVEGHRVENSNGVYISH